MKKSKSAPSVVLEVFSCSNNIAGGATTYLLYVAARGASGASALETDGIAAFVAPIAGRIHGLSGRAQSAPGAGETFTYTVRINGVATALVCVTPNPDQQSSVQAVVTFAAGDIITVQLVNSAGGAAVNHHCSLAVAFG